MEQKSETYHEYIACCTPEQYEKYGQLNGELMMERHIITLGIASKNAIQDEGKVYHHMLVVWCPNPVNDLPELFPDITTSWAYAEKKREQGEVKKMPPFTMHQTNDDGTLHINTLTGVTFRG